MAEAKKDFYKAEYYQNRELSWLNFNSRVLEEAKDRSLPLMERLKFLGITASNLDEFFMVRVASLKDMVHAGYKKTDISGLRAGEQLTRISAQTHAFSKEQYHLYSRSLLPLLKKSGLKVIVRHEELTQEQKAAVDRYFMEEVYPVLTPMAVDSSRPFPLIQNKTLNLGALIQKEEDDLEFAMVQVPSVLPRYFLLPGEKKCLIFLEEIIERNIQKLFLNYKVICIHPFRIMRNADLSIDEDGAEDLLKTIEKQLKKRRWGEVIRLEVEEGIDKRLLKLLRKEFRVQDEDIYPVSGPLDLTVLSKISGLEGFEELRAEKWIPKPVPALQNEDDIFTNIRKKDILLFHPYETFDPVVNFIGQAASDPKVLAIKQTLYRVSGHSPIIAHLARAAENGKQVTVLVELKARFDEENNINWAKMLEKAGCHVIYGLKGLKTHCKITLVVRREEDGIRRYVHLGTGNYNDSTAKLYTDMGMFTCEEAIGQDATAVFNMLSGYSEPLSWNRLAVAPLWMKNRFLKLIERERKHAEEGRKGYIAVKMNSLCDADMIEALYEASSAGVEIDLVIRGICSLRVGIPGVSENIHVRSIVGNFLEHSRIFYFYNDGREEVYMGSADWMPRNLERRVEIVFPVNDEDLKKEVIHILQIQLKDNVKARILQPDDSYRRAERRGQKPLNSQEYFCEEAAARISTGETAFTARRFVPRESEE